MKTDIEIEDGWLDRPASDRRAVLVQCASVRHMAYRDAAGNWRDYFDHHELTGEVVELPS